MEAHASRADSKAAGRAAGVALLDEAVRRWDEEKAGSHDAEVSRGGCSGMWQVDHSFVKFAKILPASHLRAASPIG